MDLDLQLVLVLIVRNDVAAAFADSVGCLKHEFVSVLNATLFLVALIKDFKLRYF